MPAPKPRHLPLWGRVAAIVLLVAIGGTVAAVVLLHSPGNVSHPNLSFTQTAPPPAPRPPRKRRVVDTFVWPRYGYDAGRTRNVPNSAALNPPFRVGWRYEDYALLEFPPVIFHTTLFLIDDDGSAKAIDKRNGHLIWQRKLGSLAAASPAVAVREHLIILPLLSVNPNAGHTPGNGRILALSMNNGHVVWSHVIPAGAESSPLVYNGVAYFGDGGGTVYAMRARNGHTLWTYHASGAVKGGPSYAGGDIFFGDYSGRAYALNAKTGHVVWAVGTDGTAFGFGSGNFYSTAAVAFGRVYLGNTDGRVYSFAERTGQLAWATSTGAYVYASPAVADVPGLGPTVYLGSYDGNFYAFDARSGHVRWSHAAGGRISGSPTIVGNVVYYSELGRKTTAGLNVRTGRQVFFFPDGAFNPVICDLSTVYLIGYSKIYQMIPRRGPAARRPGAAPKAAKRPRPAAGKRPRPAARKPRGKKA